MSAVWILILFAHAGSFSKGDSNSMTTVAGFSSETECNAAGTKAKTLGSGTTKDVKFVCVRSTQSK